MLRLRCSQVGLKKEKRPPGAVLLPGTQQACVTWLRLCLAADAAGLRTAWAQDTTLRRNYRALGLAQDPNPGFGRVNPQQPPAEEGETAGQDAEPTLGQLAHCDPDALRVATGQHLPKGQRPPKKLTKMQLVRSVCLLSRACSPPDARGRASWARWWKLTGTTWRRWRAT